MSWVRVDDDFYDHPKFDEVGPFGLGLWIMGLAWCNRNLTNGHISKNQARVLVSSLDKYGDVNGANVVSELLAVGLWDEIEEGWYRYHDYHDYQPTSAEVQQQRLSQHEQKVLAGKQRAAGALRDASGRLISPVQDHQHQQTTSEVSSNITTIRPAPVQPQPQPQLKEKLLSSPSDVDFTDWYSIYPRHEAKAEARKAYTKARQRTDSDTLIAAAQRYRDDPNREPAYTKLPATWLNQGCWEDEPLPTRTSTGEAREWFE